MMWSRLCDHAAAAVPAVRRRLRGLLGVSSWTRFFDMPAVVHVRVIDVFFVQLIDGYGRPCAHAATYLQSWTQSLTCPLRPMTGALG